LTLIWAAPFGWQFHQYAGRDGWHFGVGVMMGFLVSNAGFLLLARFLQDDLESVLESRKGWLIVLSVVSLAIAGMFVSFIFGLSDGDFATLQRFGGGTAAYVFALLSTALWSPILALAALSPSRVAIGAYRLINPTAVASAKSRKLVTLGLALAGIWLLILLLALAP
jgi:hypothetical protein